jgi:polysaccharide deacetylase 2 family uncharacterized protein YibQ
MIALLALVIAALWWVGRGRGNRGTSSGRGPSAGASSGAQPTTARESSAAPRNQSARRWAPAAAPTSDATAQRAQYRAAPSPGAPANASRQPESGSAPAAGRVAIIVDDVGYDPQPLNDFIALGRPLTFSILPVKGAAELSAAGAAAGFDVMLHLPMQPRRPTANPGPGCITVDMTEAQIAAQVAHDLAEVPGALGVNNHMGSRATADARVMTEVLTALRARGLFFVDSVTTGASVGAEIAARLAVPHAARDVFLDTNFESEPNTTEELINNARARVQQLGDIARRRGFAIGICHYHPRTAEMLARLLPQLEQSGVELVKVSSLVTAAAPSARGGAGDVGTSGRGRRRQPPAAAPADALPGPAR